MILLFSHKNNMGYSKCAYKPEKTQKEKRSTKKPSVEKGE